MLFSESSVATYKPFSVVALGISIICISLFIQPDSPTDNTSMLFHIIPKVNAESEFNSFIEDQERRISQGMIKESFVKIENSLSSYENNPEALNDLGSLVDSVYDESSENPILDSNIKEIYKNIMFKVGDKLQNLEFFDIALGYFDKVLVVDPFDDDALSRKGHALFNLGKVEEAKLFLNKASQINPCNLYAIIGEGLILDAEKKYALAIDTYNEALKCGKTDYRLLVNLGASYMELSEYDQAITYFQKILDMDLLSPEKKLKTYMNLGISYNMLKNHNQAISNYGKALEIDPYNSDALNGQSFSYLKKGDPDTAMFLIDKALSIDPKNKVAVTTKGEIFDYQGNHVDAIKLYDKALESEQEYGRAYTENRKADSLLALERYDEAQKLYEKTEKLYLIPSNFDDVFDAQVGLGNMYSEKDDCKNAILYYEKALENPSEKNKDQIREKHGSEETKCIDIKSTLDMTETILGVLGVGSISGAIAWIFKFKKKKNTNKTQ